MRRGLLCFVVRGHMGLQALLRKQQWCWAANCSGRRSGLLVLGGVDLFAKQEQELPQLLKWGSCLRQAWKRNALHRAFPELEFQVHASKVACMSMRVMTTQCSPYTEEVLQLAQAASPHLHHHRLRVHPHLRPWRPRCFHSYPATKTYAHTICGGTPIPSLDLGWCRRNHTLGPLIEFLSDLVNY